MIEYRVLGFQVIASVEGGKKPEPISQRFTSRAAANDYCELAKKNGFLDAFVKEVEGIEAKDKEPRGRMRKHIQPPLTESK